MKKINRKKLLAEILTVTSIGSQAQTNQVHNPSNGFVIKISGGTAWTNPGNISRNDRLVASTLLGISPDCSNDDCSRSQHLIISGFNFSIPESAMIEGIKVEIKKNSPRPNAVVDYLVGLNDSFSLINDWPAKLSANKATGNFWGTSYTYTKYGDKHDLWSRNWTPAQINGATFGLVFQCQNQSTTKAEANIDHVRITVYYREGTASRSQTKEIRSKATTLVSFPDPENDILDITLDLAMNSFITIKLFDLESNEILGVEETAGKGSWNKKISIKELKAGMYIARVSTDHGFTRIKRFNKFREADV